MRLIIDTDPGMDPEAADIVFRSGAPITMVGLDVCHRTQFDLSDGAALRGNRGSGRGRRRRRSGALRPPVPGASPHPTGISASATGLRRDFEAEIPVE